MPQAFVDPGGPPLATVPPPAKSPVKAPVTPVAPYKPVAPATTKPTQFAGAGPYRSWNAVPGGEQNLLSDLRNQFENLIGFTTPISTATLLKMANDHVLTLRDFGTHATDYGVKLDNYPWAKYGLDKEEYAATASVYQTEFKTLTGQDIPQSQLQQAFRNPRDLTGGLLTATQYREQLRQDANIQNTYGWVKYGLDYSAWQQQKLSMRTQLGRDVNDADASTLLQYNTQARGSNQQVSARVPQTQPTLGAAGIGQSLVR